MSEKLKPFNQETKKPNYVARRFGAGVLAVLVTLGGITGFDTLGPKQDVKSVTESVKQGSGYIDAITEGVKDLGQDPGQFKIGELGQEYGSDHPEAQPGTTIKVTQQESPIFHRVDIKVDSPEK